MAIRVTRNPYDPAKLGSYASNWLDTIIAFKPFGDTEFHYVNPADYIRADTVNGSVDYLPDEEPRIQLQYDRNNRPINIFTRQKLGEVHIVQHIKQGCGSCLTKMRAVKWYDPAACMRGSTVSTLTPNEIEQLMAVNKQKFQAWLDRH